MDTLFRPRSVEALCAEANRLGFEAEALQKYVENQQAIDIEREKREFELEKIRLQQVENDKTGFSGKKKVDRLDKNFKCYVDGEDLVYFLRLFEATAARDGIDVEDWPLVLSNKLIIKLRDFMIQENLIGNKDYDLVKRKILKQADYTEESCRRRWHEARPKNGDFRDFNVTLKQTLENWIKTSGTPETFEGLKELLLRDRIYQEVSEKLAQHLLMIPLKDSESTLEAIDKFKAAHSGKAISRRSNVDRNHVYVASAALRTFRDIECWTCGQKGHTSRWCQRNSERDSSSGGHSSNERRQDRERVTRRNGRPMVNQQGRCSQSFMPVMQKLGEDHLTGIKCREKLSNQNTTFECQASTLNLLENRDNAKSIGGLNIESGMLDNRPVTILRDTGCSIIGIRDDLVREGQKITGSFTLKLIDGQTKIYPLAWINIDTPYLKGVYIAARFKDPIADVIIRNVDEARGSQHDNDVHISRTRLGDPMDESNDIGNVSSSTTLLGEDYNQFKQNQMNDVTLQRLWEKARLGTVDEKKSGLMSFVVKEGLLYKQFCRKDNPNVTENYLVVPKNLRRRVLKTAHAPLSARHVSIYGTEYRLYKNFYWPVVDRDIGDYVKTCVICQRARHTGRE